MFDPRPIQGVSFDFYQTLVRHRGGLGRGATLMAYLDEHGLVSDPWQHQVLYDVFSRHDVEYDPGATHRVRLAYYERLTTSLFQRLSVRAPRDAAAAHAVAIWRILGPQSFDIFTDAPDTLGQLRDAGYPMVVTSNWQRGLRHFVAELGLAEYFRHVLASAEIGSAKPEGGIFEEACRRLEMHPTRVLHVGDSAVDDVEGARAAGLHVLRIDRDAACDLATSTISRLNDLIPLLTPR